ncbi:U6 snRNA-associated Sm-like protein LSm7 [Coprinopsis marcescibilis]|uniref:U6 snRNA-associated Sm-like protein LSm7 n=1 Tax=Coprinopsis marcescibilis TaxID=230819 RepID=A0A5C3KWF6_COPMA|nr:U6 snRNA-associated Sm-like protein LSm7 [Coprinopsis marcescibilis]
MADRGRGIARGGPRGGPPMRGGRHPAPGAGGHQGGPPGDKPKREAILDLAKYTNEKIRVKFTGGREVIGILKGFDQLLNLVLDEVEEEVSASNPYNKRSLGLVVLRGPTITLLSPVDGFEEIANPFVGEE